jgi:signal transduction histidine kinase
MDEQGIALLCDAEGRVQSVIHDSLGIASRLAPGTSLLQLADAVDAEKARHFLGMLQGRQAAFDWEITVALDGRLEPLHFAGGRVEDGYLVIVARTRDALGGLSEELMRINNEQMNSLRAAVKELSLHVRQGGSADDAMFDELSRVNNELANLQRQMAKANIELARLNEQKNQLLGMAAHDLRNPLGVIMSYAKFLDRMAGARLDDKERQFIAQIGKSSQFMLRLLEDLLDVSQIESGKLLLARAPFELGAALEGNVELNRVLAGAKNIAIELERPAEPLWVEADATKIEQVLNNLISNAVKYSQPGTTVRVTLEADAGNVSVRVRDQGQGIPEAELAKLFQPFSKTSVKSTGGEKSTGLGLAITRRIVEGHGGRIDVESRVGEGSSFRFTLPRRTSPETSGAT